MGTSLCIKWPLTSTFYRVQKWIYFKKIKKGLGEYFTNTNYYISFCRYDSQRNRHFSLFQNYFKKNQLSVWDVWHGGGTINSNPRGIPITQGLHSVTKCFQLLSFFKVDILTTVSSKTVSVSIIFSNQKWPDIFIDYRYSLLLRLFRQSLLQKGNKLTFSVQKEE